MPSCPALLPSPSRLRRAAGRRWGFTLVEVMISLAVLSIATMGGIAAFLTLNRYAANLRNMAEARALCQERIEQALTLGFRPTANPAVVPLAPNSDPVTSKSVSATLAILGSSANYSTSGAFTGGAGCQTSLSNGVPETIPIYTQSDGTSAKSSANVTYVRTTTVSPTAFTYPTLGNPLNLVLFTVNVSYVFHGQSYSTSMSTLRCPDQ